MKRATLVLAVAALAVAALAFSADTFNLKRTPKKGQTYTYKMTAETEVQGQKVNFTAKSTEKVTEVKEDGNYVVEAIQKDVVINVGGQEMPAPGTDEPSSTTYKKDGTVVEIKLPAEGGSPGESYRMAVLGSWVVDKESYKVGDKWSAKYATDEKKGYVATTIDYEVLAQEKVGKIDCVKVKVVAKEKEGSDPATLEGTLWIDPTDGAMVKGEMLIKKAPIMGMVLEELKMKLEREEAK